MELAGLCEWKSNASGEDHRACFLTKCCFQCCALAWLYKIAQEAQQGAIQFNCDLTINASEGLLRFVRQK